MKVHVSRETFRLREVFAISRGSKTTAEVIVVKIELDGASGNGECVPYARYGETLESVEKQLASISQHLSGNISRDSLTELLPAGAARNALDCALWDLEAKKTGKSVAELAGIAPLKALETAYTLSLDVPENMLKAAKANSDRPILKIKLGGKDDLTCLEAVRTGAPRSKLIIDANEGWSAEQWLAIQPSLVEIGVDLVEQPLPVNEDEVLLQEPRLVPVCADESCHTSDDLDQLLNRYDFINIKLDKAGGLTEALKLCEAGKERGFGIMTGCMVGSSLAMAPAMLPAQFSAYVDLDGPLLLAEDRRNGLVYKGSRLTPPKPELWG